MARFQRSTAETSVREVADWRKDAVCRFLPPELFFPDDSDLLGAEQAKAACMQCPVRGECLAWALDNERPGARFGVWGALTPPERNRMYRRRWT